MKRYHIDPSKGKKDNPIETNNQIDTLYNIPANTWYKFKCVKCGKEILRQFKRNRLEFYKKFLCGECGREATMIELLGVPHALQNKKCIAKMENTNMLRHGTKHYMTYGSTEFKSMMKDKHGDENYCNREQILKTCNQIFGGNSPFSSEEVRESAKSTLIEKFGVDNVFKLKEFQDLACDIMISKYGVPYSGMSDYLQSKTIDTKLNIYGTICLSARMLFYGVTFDSTWELAIWIYCIDHNIPIMRNPCTFTYKDAFYKDRIYEPDFRINGKLVEVKGNQFWKEDGTMRYPFNTKKVDGKWVELDPEERAYYDDLYERKHQCGLQHGVEFWRKADCKMYIDYCDFKYPNWQIIFRRDNPYNPSYWYPYVPSMLNTNTKDPNYKNKGFTPYDLKEGDEYTPIIGKGVTPFDIGLGYLNNTQKENKNV